jgi:hypothetical protein
MLRSLLGSKVLTWVRPVRGWLARPAAHRRIRAVVEECEPRILYSADLNPALWGDAVTPAEVRLVAPAAVLPAAAAQAQAPAQTAPPGDPRAAASVGAQSAAQPNPQEQRRNHEIVFVDAGVPDSQALIDAVLAARGTGTSAGIGADIEIVRLSCDADGLRQIGDVLSAEHDVSAIHIISHGAAGQLQLGNGNTDTATLRQRAGELQAWRAAFTGDADILLYGCNAGEGEAGSAFIGRLALLTGADVAASTDATGSSARGGNWVLEAETGRIEAQFGAAARQLELSWNGLLPFTASGNDTLINTTTANTQQTTALSGSQIASSASGSFVAVWEDTITDHVYARLYNADGTAAAAEFRVNTNITGALNKDQPTVAMDSAGNFVVAWRSQNQDGGSYGIYAQRYNVSGVAQGGEFLVNTATTNAQERPAIAMNSSGFVITWTSASQDGGGDGIYAQRYNASGVAQGSEFRVNTTTSNDQNGSDIAMDSAGNFVIAWTSATGDGSGSGVFAQRYNASGVAQGGQVQINTTSSGNQTLGSVAMNAAGTYAVAWTSASQDGNLDGAYARLYDSGGTSLSGEILLNSTTASNQRDPSVAIDSTGRLLASWSSYDQDSSANWGIYLRQFSADGTAMTAETRVNTTTASSQEFSSVTWSAGQAVVSWSGNGAGDSDGVYFQRYSATSPGITVTPTSGLLTTEAGGTAQFSVVLTEAPIANVTIVVSSSDATEGTVSTALLTFTAADWSTPQAVTVTGVNDALADGFQGYSIVLAAATSSDANYNGLDASDVQVANSDNDITYGLITVDTTSDTADGDTTSLAALAANRGADGFISLREAITAANNTANGSAADRIHFSIAGTGTHTITPLSALPSITNALVIDASTDDSFAANGNRPAIILDGNGVATDGLTLGATAGGSTIRGLVIRDFGGDGIEIQAGSDNNVIAGNYIGRLTATGVDAGAGKGNDGNGINLNGADNTIGGTAAADANVISGNGNNGIGFFGAASNSNVVLGNTIGLNAAQSATLGNTNQGIWMGGGASHNVIGGTAAGAGNTVAGNTYAGIEISGAGTDHNTVQGNWIGTNSALATGLGNGWGVGIKLGAADTLVGGTAAGAGNVIVNGTSNHGVAITGTGSGNAVLGNQIRSNGGLGIDLAWDGITANDAGDADTGPNGLQNFPVLTSANSNTAGTTVVGTLNSNANTTYRIEFFGNRPGVADASNGEGDRYLGFVEVTTDGAGNASFNTLLANAWVNHGDKVSATATVVTSPGVYGSTSEFAANVTATASGVIVVDTTSDTSDGTTTSITNLGNSRGADGRISLREAITAANNTANGASADMIVFAIDGTGTHSISLASALPTITSAMVIDASTDDSFAANGNLPAIELNGTSAGAGVVGLNLTSGASSSTIRGLAINRFTSHGILLNGADNVTIAGNHIGVGTSGLTDLGNGANGIQLVNGAQNNIIGGLVAADRNVISGNFNAGVAIDTNTSTGNQVLGNYIGVGADGATSLGNGDDGVHFNTAGSGNIVGSAVAGGRNVISANGIHGVGVADTSGVTILGNYIGTDATGLVAKGNAGAGVQFSSAITVTSGAVGGISAGEGNLIAFNTGDGVYVKDAAITGIEILGNSITGNGGLAIDLGTNGVTANDANDADSGANNLQNFPVLGFARTDGTSQIAITGTLHSTAGNYYRVEFFASTTQDGTGYGEGQVYLGFVDVATNASGNVAFSTTLTANVAAGACISATATKSNAGYSAFADTSEFAAVVVASAAPANTVPGAQSTNEDTTKVFSSGNGNQISITDADAGGADNQVTLSVTNGSLTLAGITGLTFVAGDGTADSTMTFRGTAAAINTALNGLAYTPTADYNGGATLTIATQDSALLSLDIDTGLLGRYAFENTGALGTDTSPAAGYNGTPSGTTAVVDGTRGNVISMAGAGYVQTTGHYGNPANVTLAAWVNLTTADTNGAEVISLGDSLGIRLDDGGNLTGFFYNGSSYVANTYGVTLAGTGWHHVAYTFSDSSDAVTLYLDGVVVSSSSTAASIAYTVGANSFIGKHGNGATTFDFNGRIDEARIYNRALTASEVQVLASDLAGTDTDTVAVGVAAVNDAPTVNVVAPRTTNEDVVKVFSAFIGNAITISDVDAGSGQLQLSVTASNGTVSLGSTSGLTFSVGDGTSDTTMTFTGTLAAINTALDGIGYMPTADYNGAASLQFDLSDLGNTGSGGAQTASATQSITVLPVNDAPVFVSASNFTSITEDQVGNAGQAVSTLYSNSDVDSGAVSGVAIRGLVSGNGVWQYSIDGGSNWSAVGAVSDTSALLLRSSDRLRFVPDGIAADSGSISFYIWDQTSGSAGGTADVSTRGGSTAYSSNAGSASITVTAVNDAPVVATTGSALAYTENGAATAVDPGLTVGDADSTHLAGATVTISAGFASSEDTLAFTNQNGISGSWNPGTGVLTLAGSATVAQYQAALRSIVYVNSSDNPSTTTRTVSFVVDDGSANSTAATRNIGITATNDAPVITSNGGGPTTAVNVAENSTAVTTVTSSDVDGGTASYSITGGADAALFAIDGSTGALTFVSARNFESPTDAGGDNVYDVTVQVSDGAGGTDTQDIAVTVTNVNEAPVNAVPGTQTVAEDTPLAIGGLSVADVDGNLSTLQLSVGNGSITVTLSGGATISGGANASATLTLAGSSAQINAALATLSYQGNADFNGSDTLTVLATDAAALTDSDTVAITVSAANDAPMVSAIESTALATTENDAAAAITSTLVLGDVDNANLTGATVQIAANFVAGEDVLAFTNQNGISGSWNAGTGVLTLSGSATVAQYQAALRSITYINSSDNPSTATRTVSFVVSDGAANSNTGTRDIGIAAVNDAPVIGSDGAGSSASIAVAEGQTVVTTVTSSDVDGGTAMYSIGGGADAARFVIDSATGVLSFVAAPDFEAPTDAGGDNVYDVTVQVSDGALTDSQNIAVTVTAVNDNAPVITSNGGHATADVTVAENGTAVTRVTATDTDLPSQTLTYAIAGGADAAKFTIDANTGVLRFTAAPDFETPGDVGADNVYELVVQASDGQRTGAQAVRVTVTDANEAPSLLLPSAAAVDENAPAGTLVARVVASDPDAGDVFTFALVSDANGRFTIDAANGTIRVAPSALLNFELNPSFDLLVSVTDAAGRSTQRVLRVALNDVSEPAPVVPVQTPAEPVTATPAPSPAAAPAPSPATATAPAPAPATPPAPAAGAAPGPSPAPAPATAIAAEAAKGPGPSTQRGSNVALDEGAAAGAPPATALSGFDDVAPGSGRRGSAAGVVSPFAHTRDGAHAIGTLVSLSFGLLGATEAPVLVGAWDDARAAAPGADSAWRGSSSAHRSNAPVEADTALAHRAAAATREPATLAEVVLDPVRVSSVAFSAGFIWWLTRSGGLLMTMLMGIPAWRHIDLLPVLARPIEEDDEEDESHAGAAAGRDGDAVASRFDVDLGTHDDAELNADQAVNVLFDLGTHSRPRAPSP